MFLLSIINNSFEGLLTSERSFVLFAFLDGAFSFQKNKPEDGLSTLGTVGFKIIPLGDDSPAYYLYY